MDSDTKFRLFKTLVKLGYKEIEVSYPSSSATDFDFTRRLIETPETIADDVWIQVMTPCREELIRKTINSVRGANKAIIHVYLATSECFRRVVFNMTEEETLDLAVRSTKLIRKLTKDNEDAFCKQTEWALEFTPEVFQDTTLDFAIRICEAVKAAWEPSVENPIIFNLPATVEMAMPNVFADQIELFCTNITERDKVCVSLHNHNDRGCAVAAAEMAQLAGADRVEGCLFGNGERTGNVDLVTLAMNLYTQGIDPQIDFSNINDVIEIVEDCTKVPVHVRAPYAGKYVFCTFTGAHQDAIRKGYKERERSGEQKWRMPYLPMDPHDLGRKHEAVIRVNSQSGKSGSAWLVKEAFQIDMPRDLEIAFSQVVQDYANTTGLEVTLQTIEHIFRNQYMLINSSELALNKCKLYETPAIFMEEKSISWVVRQEELQPSVEKPANSFLNVGIMVAGENLDIWGHGNDAFSSILNAAKVLGFGYDCLQYHLKSVENDKSSSIPSQVVSFVQLTSTSGQFSWGVGIHNDQVWASTQAVSRHLYPTAYRLDNTFYRSSVRQNGCLSSAPLGLLSVRKVAEFGIFT
jgi:2-isopropylmalate synthase